MKSLELHGGGFWYWMALGKCSTADLYLEHGSCTSSFLPSAVKGGGSLFLWRTRGTRTLDCSELVLYGWITEANYHVLSLRGDEKSRAKLSLLVTVWDSIKAKEDKQIAKTSEGAFDSWNADRAPGC